MAFESSVLCRALAADEGDIGTVSNDHEASPGDIECSVLADKDGKTDLGVSESRRRI